MRAELDHKRPKGGGGTCAVLGVGALNLAGNCYSKCREPGTHTQLFLLHRLTGAGVGGRVRSPITDVSNPD